MFALTPGDLEHKILDCAAGPSKQESAEDEILTVSQPGIRRVRIWAEVEEQAVNASGSSCG
jgi:hypothetical protein